MYGYDIVDKILECLKDCEKHEIERVRSDVCCDEFKFKKLVELLGSMDLISVEGDEIIITKSTRSIKINKLEEKSFYGIFKREC